MKQLGIGVRVWVGWTSDMYVQNDLHAASARLSEGIVIDGPYQRGAFMPGTGLINGLNEPKWDVEIKGATFYVGEHLLTPIDDDPDAVTEPTEQEETA